MKNLIVRIITHHRLPALILTVCIFFCVPLFIGKDGTAIEKLNFKNNESNKQAFIPNDNKLSDVNDIHLGFATTVGITPFSTNEELLSSIDSLRAVGALTYIVPCREFDIEKLSHSHPYLTRQARQLLIDIGERFRQKQIEKGLKVHKMVITSMLRTEQSQKSLRRRNFNATKSTTSHLYGTTFDISAQRFVRYDFLGNKSETSRGIYQKLLEEAVKELRNEGRCVVMREYKQACLHITVTN